MAKLIIKGTLKNCRCAFEDEILGTLLLYKGSNINLNGEDVDFSLEYSGRKHECHSLITGYLNNLYSLELINLYFNIKFLTISVI